MKPVHVGAVAKGLFVGNDTSQNVQLSDKFRRLALAPGLLAAIVLIAGFALIEGGGFIVIRYVVAILALIIGYFAFQAKQWWWMPLLLAIAVVWNPVLPFGFAGIYWYGAQYAAIVVFILTAIFVKVPLTQAEKPGRAR